MHLQHGNSSVAESLGCQCYYGAGLAHWEKDRAATMICTQYISMVRANGKCGPCCNNSCSSKSTSCQTFIDLSGPVSGSDTSSSVSDSCTSKSTGTGTEMLSSSSCDSTTGTAVNRGLDGDVSTVPDDGVISVSHSTREKEYGCCSPEELFPDSQEPPMHSATPPVSRVLLPQIHHRSSCSSSRKRFAFTSPDGYLSVSGCAAPTSAPVASATNASAVCKHPAHAHTIAVPQLLLLGRRSLHGTSQVRCGEDAEGLVTPTAQYVNTPWAPQGQQLQDQYAFFSEQEVSSGLQNQSNNAQTKDHHYRELGEEPDESKPCSPFSRNLSADSSSSSAYYGALVEHLWEDGFFLSARASPSHSPTVTLHKDTPPQKETHQLQATEDQQTREEQTYQLEHKQRTNDVLHGVRRKDVSYEEPPQLHKPAVWQKRQLDGQGSCAATQKGGASDNSPWRRFSYPSIGEECKKEGTAVVSEEVIRTPRAVETDGTGLASAVSAEGLRVLDLTPRQTMELYASEGYERSSYSEMQERRWQQLTCKAGSQGSGPLGRGRCRSSCFCYTSNVHTGSPKKRVSTHEQPSDAPAKDHKQVVVDSENHVPQERRYTETHIRTKEDGKQDQTGVNSESGGDVQQEATLQQGPHMRPEDVSQEQQRQALERAFGGGPPMNQSQEGEKDRDTAEERLSRQNSTTQQSLIVKHREEEEQAQQQVDSMLLTALASCISPKKSECGVNRSAHENTKRISFMASKTGAAPTTSTAALPATKYQSRTASPDSLNMITTNSCLAECTVMNDTAANMSNKIARASRETTFALTAAATQKTAAERYYEESPLLSSDNSSKEHCTSLQTCTAETVSLIGVPTALQRQHSEISSTDRVVVREESSDGKSRGDLPSSTTTRCSRVLRANSNAVDSSPNSQPSNTLDFPASPTAASSYIRASINSGGISAVVGSSAGGLPAVGTSTNCAGLSAAETAVRSGGLSTAEASTNSAELSAAEVSVGSAVPSAALAGLSAAAAAACRDASRSGAAAESLFAEAAPLAAISMVGGRDSVAAVSEEKTASLPPISPIDSKVITECSLPLVKFSSAGEHTAPVAYVASAVAATCAGPSSPLSTDQVPSDSLIHPNIRPAAESSPLQKSLSHDIAVVTTSGVAPHSPPPASSASLSQQVITHAPAGVEPSILPVGAAVDAATTAGSATATKEVATCLSPQRYSVASDAPVMADSNPCAATSAAGVLVETTACPMTTAAAGCADSVAEGKPAADTAAEVQEASIQFAVDSIAARSAASSVVCARPCGPVPSCSGIISGVLEGCASSAQSATASIKPSGISSTEAFATTITDTTATVSTTTTDTAIASGAKTTLRLSTDFAVSVPVTDAAAANVAVAANGVPANTAGVSACSPTGSELACSVDTLTAFYTSTGKSRCTRKQVHSLYQEKVVQAISAVAAEPPAIPTPTTRATVATGVAEETSRVTAVSAGAVPDALPLATASSPVVETQPKGIIAVRGLGTVAQTAPAEGGTSLTTEASAGHSIPAGELPRAGDHHEFCQAEVTAHANAMLHSQPGATVMEGKRSRGLEEAASAVACTETSKGIAEGVAAVTEGLAEETSVSAESYTSVVQAGQLKVARKAAAQASKSESYLRGEKHQIDYESNRGQRRSNTSRAVQRFDSGSSVQRESFCGVTSCSSGIVTNGHFKENGCNRNTSTNSSRDCRSGLGALNSSSRTDDRHEGDPFTPQNTRPTSSGSRCEYTNDQRDDHHIANTTITLSEAISNNISNSTGEADIATRRHLQRRNTSNRSDSSNNSADECSSGDSAHSNNSKYSSDTKCSGGNKCKTGAKYGNDSQYSSDSNCSNGNKCSSGSTCSNGSMWISNSSEDSVVVYCSSCCSDGNNNNKTGAACNKEAVFNSGCESQCSSSRLLRSNSRINGSLYNSNGSSGTRGVCSCTTEVTHSITGATSNSASSSTTRKATNSSATTCNSKSVTKRSKCIAPHTSSNICLSANSSNCNKRRTPPHLRGSSSSSCSSSSSSSSVPLRCDSSSQCGSGRSPLRCESSSSSSSSSSLSRCNSTSPLLLRCGSSSSSSSPLLLRCGRSSLLLRGSSSSSTPLRCGTGGSSSGSSSPLHRGSSSPPPLRSASSSPFPCGSSSNSSSSPLHFDRSSSLPRNHNSSPLRSGSSNSSNSSNSNNSLCSVNCVSAGGRFCRKSRSQMRRNGQGNSQSNSQGNNTGPEKTAADHCSSSHQWSVNSGRQPSLLSFSRGDTGNTTGSFISNSSAFCSQSNTTTTPTTTTSHSTSSSNSNTFSSSSCRSGTSSNSSSSSSGSSPPSHEFPHKKTNWNYGRSSVRSMLHKPLRSCSSSRYCVKGSPARSVITATASHHARRTRRGACSLHILCGTDLLRREEGASGEERAVVEELEHSADKSNHGSIETGEIVAATTNVAASERHTAAAAVAAVAGGGSLVVSGSPTRLAELATAEKTEARHHSRHQLPMTMKNSCVLRPANNCCTKSTTITSKPFCPKTTSQTTPKTGEREDSTKRHCSTSTSSCNTIRTTTSSTSSNNASTNCTSSNTIKSTNSTNSSSTNSTSTNRTNSTSCSNSTNSSNSTSSNNSTSSSNSTSSNSKNSCNSSSSSIGATTGISHSCQSSADTSSVIKSWSTSESSSRSTSPLACSSTSRGNSTSISSNATCCYYNSGGGSPNMSFTLEAEVTNTPEHHIGKENAGLQLYNGTSPASLFPAVITASKNAGSPAAAPPSNATSIPMPAALSCSCSAAPKRLQSCKHSGSRSRSLRFPPACAGTSLSACNGVRRGAAAALSAETPAKDRAPTTTTSTTKTTAPPAVSSCSAAAVAATAAAHASVTSSASEKVRGSAIQRRSAGSIMGQAATVAITRENNMTARCSQGRPSRTAARCVGARPVLGGERGTERTSKRLAAFPASLKSTRETVTNDVNIISSSPSHDKGDSIDGSRSPLAWDPGVCDGQMDDSRRVRVMKGAGGERGRVGRRASETQHDPTSSAADVHEQAGEGRPVTAVAGAGEATNITSTATTATRTRRKEGSLVAALVLPNEAATTNRTVLNEAARRTPRLSAAATPGRGTEAVTTGVVTAPVAEPDITLRSDKLAATLPLLTSEVEWGAFIGESDTSCVAGSRSPPAGLLQQQTSAYDYYVQQQYMSSEDTTPHTKKRRNNNVRGPTESAYGSLRSSMTLQHRRRRSRVSHHRLHQQSHPNIRKTLQHQQLQKERLSAASRRSYLSPVSLSSRRKQQSSSSSQRRHDGFHKQSQHNRHIILPLESHSQLQPDHQQPLRKLSQKRASTVMQQQEDSRPQQQQPRRGRQRLVPLLLLPHQQQKHQPQQQLQQQQLQLQLQQQQQQQRQKQQQQEEKEDEEEEEGHVQHHLLQASQHKEKEKPEGVSERLELEYERQRRQSKRHSCPIVATGKRGNLSINERSPSRRSCFFSARPPTAAMSKSPSAAAAAHIRLAAALASSQCFYVSRPKDRTTATTTTTSSTCASDTTTASTSHRQHEGTEGKDKTAMAATMSPPPSPSARLSSSSSFTANDDALLPPSGVSTQLPLLPVDGLETSATQYTVANAGASPDDIFIVTSHPSCSTPSSMTAASTYEAAASSSLYSSVSATAATITAVNTSAQPATRQLFLRAASSLSPAATLAAAIPTIAPVTTLTATTTSAVGSSAIPATPPPVNSAPANDAADAAANAVAGASVHITTDAAAGDSAYITTQAAVGGVAIPADCAPGAATASCGPTTVSGGAPAPGGAPTSDDVTVSGDATAVANVAIAGGAAGCLVSACSSVGSCAAPAEASNDATAAACQSVLSPRLTRACAACASEPTISAAEKPVEGEDAAPAPAPPPAPVVAAAAIRERGLAATEGKSHYAEASHAYLVKEENGEAKKGAVDTTPQSDIHKQQSHTETCEKKKKEEEEEEEDEEEENDGEEEAATTGNEEAATRRRLAAELHMDTPSFLALDPFLVDEADEELLSTQQLRSYLSTIITGDLENKSRDALLYMAKAWSLQTHTSTGAPSSRMNYASVDASFVPPSALRLHGRIPHARRRRSILRSSSCGSEKSPAKPSADGAHCSSTERATPEKRKRRRSISFSPFNKVQLYTLDEVERRGKEKAAQLSVQNEQQQLMRRFLLQHQMLPPRVLGPSALSEEEVADDADFTWLLRSRGGGLSEDTPSDDSSDEAERDMESMQQQPQRQEEMQKSQLYQQEQKEHIGQTHERHHIKSHCQREQQQEEQRTPQRHDARIGR